ncbi:MAG: DUF4345 family protein [Myxococcota bacterium]
MNVDRIASYGLWLLTSIFALVALLCLTDPTVLLGAMEIGLDSPSAMAEVRAGYAGTFGGLAVLFAIGARQSRMRRLALGIAAIVLGLFTLGRLLSMALDGAPNTLAFFNHALEAMGFVVALALWKALPAHAEGPDSDEGP